MAGYSGTPLASKLGVKPGMVLQAVHAPENYRALLAPLPDGARIATRAVAKADVVHHFAIRDVALPLGYVDVKVCAVTDTWSGLKLVVRRELRGKERP